MPSKKVIEDVYAEYRRLLEEAYGSDSKVKIYLRRIDALHQRIKDIWRRIANEHENIRRRRRQLRHLISAQMSRRIANRLRPNDNQIYPRTVLRDSPPPH